MSKKGAAKNLPAYIGGTAGGFSLVQLAKAMPEGSFLAEWLPQIAPLLTTLFLLAGFDIQARLARRRRAMEARQHRDELKELSLMMEKDVESQLTRLRADLAELPPADQKKHQTLIAMVEDRKADLQAQICEKSLQHYERLLTEL